ncbi:MAG: hypothetical protein Q7I98_03150 [Erysipelotrichaceae bacterium]|nr:hypothetical protein [Erysipelotrichaceae bacterium]
MNIASVDNFLGYKSNYELASFFKTTESKINSSRLNIALKFNPLTNEEYLYGFFAKISNGLIKLDYNVTDKTIELVVENNVEKREIESCAKRIGYGINYKQNREILVMKVELFISIAEELNKENKNELYSGIIQNERELRKKADRSVIRQKAFEKIGSFTKDILIGVVTEVLTSRI